VLAGVFQIPVFDFLVQIKIHAEMLATAHPAGRQLVRRNLLFLHLLRQDLSGGVELQEGRRNEIRHHGGKEYWYNASRGEEGKEAFLSGGSAERGQQKICGS